MTTVFVYEYCCAVGLGRDESDPAHSLYREGRAMRDAVADDFRRLPGVEVLMLDFDPRTQGPVHHWERVAFRKLVLSAGHTLIIAPELDEHLTSRTEWVINSRGSLIGPNVAAVQLTSSKLELARLWERSGVPTPQTLPFLDWVQQAVSRYPVVCKPVYGAGSTATVRFNRPEDVEQVYRGDVVGDYADDDLLLQDFVPGHPASIAFLIGPRETVSLLPTFQVLSDDGRFTYLGGELPIRPDLAARATRLGRRAIDCVPGLRGYVGVDLILGDAADGSADYAIEINPRLTTSYVGLRQLADFNLAGAMLAVATGVPVGDVRWKPGRVRFHPDGRVEYDPTPGATFG